MRSPTATQLVESALTSAGLNGSGRRARDNESSADPAPSSRRRSQRPSQPPPSSHTSIKRARKRVLVIDGSPTAHIAVRNALDPEEYEVEQLDCFVDLPSKVMDNPPDLILLDLNMPELSGVVMGRYIRTHEIRWTPILVYSTGQLADLHRAVREIEADGVVPRGASPEELRARVRKALEHG